MTLEVTAVECAKLKLSAKELRMIINALDYLSHDRLTYDEDFQPIMPDEYDTLIMRLTQLRMEVMSRPVMPHRWRGRMVKQHAAD